METEITFRRIKDRGDATSWYDVFFPEGMTVGDFMSWVFTYRQREHGTIYVKNPGSGVFSFNDVVATYEYGAGGRGGQTNLEILEEKIDHIEANGGWGLMSYFVYIRSEQEVSSMEIIEQGSDEKIRAYDAKKRTERMVTITCERCGCKFRVDPQNKKEASVSPYGVSAKCPYCDDICSVEDK